MSAFVQQYKKSRSTFVIVFEQFPAAEVAYALPALVIDSNCILVDPALELVGGPCDPDAALADETLAASFSD